LKELLILIVGTFCWVLVLLAIRALGIGDLIIDLIKSIFFVIFAWMVIGLAFNID